jgi:hypothetical protein
MAWVCEVGTAKRDDIEGWICIDENGDVLPDVTPKYVSDSAEPESDGNKQIRPTPLVDLGGARELGVTDTFDRSDQDIRTSIDYAEGLPNRIRAESGGTDSKEYKQFIKGLKGYFGQSFESYTSADAAWNRVVEDAKAGNKVAMDLLSQGRANFDPKDFEKGRRGSGSSGPRYTITNANEEDVYTIAQSLAMEMIGRPITEKQFGKLLSRVRQEEKANPTVTRTVGNTTTTETGITDQERQSVMAELLQERPEWRQHQMSQGVLDALTRSIQEGKRLDSGV